MKRFIRFVRRPRAVNPQRVSRKVNQLMCSGDFEGAGVLAYGSGMLWALGPTGLQKYTDLVAERDPYAAIEIWKKSPGKSSLKGVQYYLQAGQAHKAETLTAGLTEDELVKVSTNFAEYYANAKAQKNFERWSQYISPQLKTKLERRLGVPQGLDDRTMKLVACVNQIIVEEAPEFLADVKGYSMWQAFLLNPAEHERALELCLSLLHRGVELPVAEILRIMNVREATALLLQLPSYSPSTFASVARRCNPDQLKKLIGKCDPHTKYSPEVLFSIAKVDPGLFCDLDISQMPTGSSLPEHVLAAIWQASCDRPMWLFSLTLDKVTSYGLLRSAAEALVLNREWSKLEQLFTAFVQEKNLSIDTRLLEELVDVAAGRSVNKIKLPRPPRAYSNEWQRTRMALERIKGATDP